jgi:hypothetical protein
MVFMAIIFGVLGASFALLLELVFLNATHLYDYTSLTFNFSSLFLIATTALIEEGSKYLFLRQYLIRFNARFSRLRTALLQACCFGIGFASLEGALALSTGPLSQDSWFIVGTTLLHVTTSIIIATFLRRGSSSLLFNFIFPLTCAFFLHTLYNTALTFFLV